MNFYTRPYWEKESRIWSYTVLPKRWYNYQSLMRTTYTGTWYSIVVDMQFAICTPQRCTSCTVSFILVSTSFHIRTSGRWQGYQVIRDRDDNGNANSGALMKSCWRQHSVFVFVVDKSGVWCVLLLVCNVAVCGNVLYYAYRCRFVYSYFCLLEVHYSLFYSLYYLLLLGVHNYLSTPSII